VPDEQLITLAAFHRVGRASIPVVAGQREAVADMNRRLSQGELPVEAVACLCGGSTFAEIATTDRYGIAQETVICTACGLVQSNPRLTAAGYHDFYASDLYRRIYDGPQFLERYEENYTDGRGDAVLEWVAADGRLDAIGSLVEFGAGGGWNLAPFVAAGVPARGYDLSSELLPLAAEHGVEVRQGGLEDVEGTHDAILLLHVLEHMLDPVQALRTLAAHLAPGGRLFVEVPDIENFAIGQLQNAHTYYFSERTLRHYAARAGLVATSFEHVAATGHMRGVFVQAPGGRAPESPLDGHYDEMAERLRRYNRDYRLGTPVRAAGRALDAVGLKQRVKRVLGR
jgi:2-polyprenyl-3-methyl-5-hydroxy-6-metoxy-1,4-benzoquinol methylase